MPSSSTMLPPAPSAAAQSAPRARKKSARGETGAPREVNGDGTSGRRTNVYRVAELAGVSPGTVSRVLNNRGRVHSDTRARVLDVARTLGFRPQVQVRTKQVAVISDNTWHSRHNGSYYQAVWAQIALALCKHDMAMIVPDTPDELRRQYLDGIIVVGEYPRLRPILAELRTHTPIVLTDDFSEMSADYWNVRSDRSMTGNLAAGHFAKTGRKRLGFVCSQGAQEQVILDSYRATMRKAGLECHEELFVMRNEEVTFYSAVSRVIRLGADALLIPGSNYEALEGLNVISNVLRMQVPKDIALIGGEVLGVSEFLTPPMTTVEEPLMNIANQAVETLAALMRGEKPQRENLLPVRLRPRESA